MAAQQSQIAEQQSQLQQQQQQIEDLHWLAGHAPALDGEEFACMARLRHRQPLQAARAVIHGDKARITFDAPQRAITPGQATVLYQGQLCLGGGPVGSADSQ